MEWLSILGATGSIGASTLDVVSRHRERFRVFALSANRDVVALAALCERHRPRFAVVTRPGAADELRRLLRSTDAADVEVRSGEEALCEMAGAAEVDTVVAGIVGAAGLAPTLAAVRAGKRVLLANKEALVMAGRLFMAEVEHSGAQVLPVDSEHNAIYQCLPTHFQRDGLGGVGVRRILLTASGGPFRTHPVDRLDSVTPEQACAHPNWAMGRKISVDSATMMNKGLELIEACWLFATEPQRVEVVIHPQSIVHSLVEYVDGSVLAQLGNPDMRTPIAHALACPERLEAAVAPLDLLAIGRLEFEAPDAERFPCLGLAAAAMNRGGTAPAGLNAANEVAVAAFLERRIRFTDIPRVIEGALARTPWTPADSMDQILAADDEARQRARAVIGALPQG